MTGLWRALLRPFWCFSLNSKDEETAPPAGAAGYEQVTEPPAQTSEADYLPGSTASPKRKRDDLLEGQENQFQQTSGEQGVAHKRPSIQEPTGAVDEWEAMRSPSKSIPRTPIGINDGFKKDSFKFALSTPGDFKTPIGGGTFMAKQPSTPADEFQAPAKLSEVREEQGEQIKAQHVPSSELPAEVPIEASAVGPVAAAAPTPSPASEKGDQGLKTPAFLLSASSADASPHVSGRSNPATNFKEGKAVRTRGTPFEARVESEMEREQRFSSGAKHEFRGRLSDIVANQAMQLRSSPAPASSRPWR